MGEVALKYRLMPESPAVDTAAVVAALPATLPADAKLGAHEVSPFAFGLMAIDALVIGPDRAGLVDEVEAGLASLESIQSVELLEQSLL
ncbi:MAG: elongation factor 1-beta [Candidatus Poseidoniia archaeon]|jgi:translation elongation factor aEF-1 beta|nr:elongation factor 1-beta [Candidatus Poseidoniia archaeon]MDP6658282.1 elongation factor 1-beta [Candidatus Poseidoniia archaeon]|tara:strand:- start:4855 stop:5121 length:267 start_codon:yes stop_codon:yes gene_type:complete